MNNLTTTLALIRQHKWLIFFGCLAALIYELLNFNRLVPTFTHISILDLAPQLSIWILTNSPMDSYPTVITSQLVLLGGFALIGLFHTFGRAFLIEAVEQYQLHDLVTISKTTRHTVQQLHKLIVIDLQCIAVWLICTLPLIFAGVFGSGILESKNSTFLSPLIIALPPAYPITIGQLLAAVPSSYAIASLCLILIAIFLLIYRQFIFHEIILHEVTIQQAKQNAWQLVRQNWQNILKFLRLIIVGHIIAYALLGIFNLPAILAPFFLSNETLLVAADYLGFILQWGALGSFYVLSAIVWTNKYLQLYLASTFIKSHDPR